MTATTPETAGRKSPRDTAPPSEELALLDYAERLERHRAGRTAIHIHLSRLQSHNRREQHIRVAINTFTDLVKHFEGQIFKMLNQDLVLICKGAEPARIEDAVQKLRYLFSEDPLTRFTEDQSGGFCTWYAMEQDYPGFLKLAQQFFALNQAQRENANRKFVAKPEPKKEQKPLTPAVLAKLVDSLRKADLSPIVRNQAVCVVVPGQAPQTMFHEMYVSIGDLENVLMPDISITGEPWLFKYLTQTLDRRMLAQILRDHQGGSGVFSLNLNISTILSQEFQRFDQAISTNVRGRLVVELQKEDIFADMGAYLFAREYLRERGFKICLDGLTHLTLPYLDWERLGLDLVKMFWSAELAGGVKPEILDGLEKQIKQGGRARFILSRCDNEAAITVGHKLGINLFQGRYIDHLINSLKPAAERQGSLRHR